jgi:CHAT domain-containing protein/tetratricopeptide (TPR) repeat protein
VRAAEDSLGADHAITARATLALGRIEHAIGAYRQAADRQYIGVAELDEAHRLYPAATAVLQRRLGRDHVEVLDALYQWGDLLRRTHRYDEAADALRQVVARASDDLQARARIDLAVLRVLERTTAKRIAEAFELADAAVADAERTLAPDHPSAALALVTLAGVHQTSRSSSPEVARLLEERALGMRERSLGPHHWDVVSSLRALADVDVKRKDAERAVAALARALAIEERALGPDHASVRNLVTALGRVHEALADETAAEKAYVRVLETYARQGTEDGLPGALENLARLYRRMGRYDDAEPVLVRALAIRERNMGAGHLTVAETLRALGTIHRVRGAFDAAEPLYARAIEIHRRHGGEAFTWALRDGAALAVARKDYPNARRLLEASLRNQDAVTMNLLLRPGREEEQLDAVTSWRVAGTFRFLVWLVLRHLREDPAAVTSAAEAVLDRKGAVLDAQSRAAAPIDRLSPEARRAHLELVAARTALATLLLRRPKDLPDDEYRRRLVAAFERSGEAEATSQRLIAAAPPSPEVTVAALRARLPADTAFVDFVSVPDFDYGREDFEFPSRGATARWRYAAFVLRPSVDVALVDLGMAEAVDETIDRIRRGMLGDESEELRSLRDLHGKVWAPLESPLAGAARVLLSPDGKLNLVSFATMIDGADRFVLERYTVAYVTSGREMMDDRARAPGSALLLVADPDFETVPASSAIAVTSERSRDFSGEFHRLAGTAREADEIPSLLVFPGERTVLRGSDATERAVKQARSPRVLHLATHGFFLPDQTLSAAQAQHESPLVRSGLAFAGANRAADTTGGDDGLLTALEISGMDLSSTELVVLSACETGIGAPRIGEGVFGLRRAFVLAGVRNLVMSLWRVGDRITADQMHDFYAALATVGPAEALREAQLRTIRAARAEGREAPPRLWGPFIFQGSPP